MRKITLLYIGVFLIALLSADFVRAAEQNFFVSMQDMPLMKGLYELEDQTVSFDKPEGRITESVALIEDMPREMVSEFYAEILPQFGWHRMVGDSYVRQNEMLELQFENFEDQDYLRLMISPYM